MKIIVVGASGFIGNDVYKSAKARNFEVIGTSTKGSEEFISYDLLNDKPTAFEKYLSSDEKIFAVVTAAKTNIGFCYANEELTNQINIKAIQDLLKFFDSRGIKSIYFSSDYVFDGKTGNYDENSAVNPTTVYGKQKAVMEEFILKNLPEVLVYRITKSVDDNYRDKNVFTEMYDAYKNNKTLRCIRGLTYNPTLSADLVDCIFTGLEMNLSGLYNVANPEVYSRLELTEKFFEHHNYKNIVEVDLSEFNFTEPRSLNTTLNVNKFQTVTGKKFTKMNDVIKNFWKKIGDA